MNEGQVNVKSTSSQRQVNVKSTSSQRKQASKRGKPRAMGQVGFPIRFGGVSYMIRILMYHDVS